MFRFRGGIMSEKNYVNVWNLYEAEKAKIRDEEERSGKRLPDAEYHKRIDKICDDLGI